MKHTLFRIAAYLTLVRECPDSLGNRRAQSRVGMALAENTAMATTEKNKQSQSTARQGSQGSGKGNTSSNGEAGKEARSAQAGSQGKKGNAQANRKQSGTSSSARR